MTLADAFLNLMAPATLAQLAPTLAIFSRIVSGTPAATPLARGASHFLLQR